MEYKPGDLVVIEAGAVQFFGEVVGYNTEDNKFEFND